MKIGGIFAKKYNKEQQKYAGLCNYSRRRETRLTVYPAIEVHSGDASAARGAGTFWYFSLTLLISVRAKKYDLELKLSEKLANIWNFNLRKYELLKI